MSEQFHIIIAGDQHTPLSFKISRKQLFITIAITICVALTVSVTGISTGSLFARNKVLEVRMALAKKKMLETAAENEKLETQLATLTEDQRNAIEKLKKENALLLTKMELETKKITELEQLNVLQEEQHRQERDQLLATAVSELNARSNFIEDVISDIGVKVKTKSRATSNNSGGPYVAAENATYDELLFRADSYLKTIQTLPLGKPVTGSVSSGYGRRKDPFNNKRAFHEGIDFRGKKGDPVIATADGKVVFAGRNGGFGKFVKIDHGNGYTTAFAHLSKYHVKKGDRVTRGQVIARVGNSGRSTGSHLHYEIAFKGKHVNPNKFMKVAGLTFYDNYAPQKKKKKYVR